MCAESRVQAGSQSAPSRETKRITVCPLANGSTLTLTVLVANGSRPGPRVGIAAAIHGDEIVGVQVIRELWQSLDVSCLSGSVWFLPVANPLAFEALTRNTPIDMLDLNRNFPGAVDGWLSEQIAAAISAHYLRHLTHFIDIHAGGTFPLVDYCYLLNDPGFSRAFLSKLLFEPGDRIQAGADYWVAKASNISTAVIELGGGYEDQGTQVARGAYGVRNMLRYAGALPGEVERADGQLLIHDLRTMRPRAGGLCYPTAPLTVGTVLEGHLQLAEIVSPYTFETLETIVAPFERNVVVLSRNYTTRINPGDYMFMIGDLDTAEQLPRMR